MEDYWHGLHLEIYYCFLSIFENTLRIDIPGGRKADGLYLEKHLLCVALSHIEGGIVWHTAVVYSYTVMTLSGVAAAVLEYQILS